MIYQHTSLSFKLNTFLSSHVSYLFYLNIFSCLLFSSFLTFVPRVQVLPHKSSLCLQVIFKNALITLLLLKTLNLFSRSTENFTFTATLTSCSVPLLFFSLLSQLLQTIELSPHHCIIYLQLHLSLCLQVPPFPFLPSPSNLTSPHFYPPPSISLPPSPSSLPPSLTIKQSHPFTSKRAPSSI